ncbi:MAG: hypothetical protein MJZ50_01740 [Treponema sp.]|nr:hypothetical protein [Treponema sp.]
MSDTIVDKARENPLGLLDMEDNIERILPGPTETERNESRLNKVITGEKRPLSHTGKEAASWALADGIPFLAWYLKAARVSDMGLKGLSAISKTGGSGGMQKMMKTAEKGAKKAVEEASKNEVQKKPVKSVLGKIMQMAQNSNFHVGKGPLSDKSIAEKNLKNIETAIEAISSKPAGVQPRDAIKAFAKEKGGKTAAKTYIAEKLGRVLGKGTVDSGDYGKVEDLEGYDNSIEMGGMEKALHFISGLFDLDTLNPDKYPMDTINAVLEEVNRETGKWSSIQLNRLGDDEKVKLIKNIAKGKYDSDDKTLSYELYKAYKKLTNNTEENK